MKLTFGEELESFSRSVDILRFDGLERVLDQTVRYLTANFNISKVERLIERVYQGVPNLEPTLDKDEYEHYPVRNEDGSPQGLNAYSFIKGRPIWVVPEDPDETLDKAGALRELWDPETNTNLPPYVRLKGYDQEDRPERPTKTLIGIPKNMSGRTTSLVYFESNEYMLASKRAEEELLRVANAVARLYEVADQSAITTEATGEEIKALGETSRIVIDWGVTLPTLFFAYPDGADSKVVEELNRQVAILEAGEIVRVFDWGKNYESGKIPEKIEKEIAGATYFLAYASELQEIGDATTYIDNPNVMFEAGMFKGLTTDRTKRAADWLLVREEKSAAPFDISSENWVLVKRPENGAPDLESFREKLTNHLIDLIPDLPDAVVSLLRGEKEAGETPAAS